MEKATQDVLIVGGGVPALERVVPLLERAALRVSHVAGGVEALALLRGDAFDLIILRHPIAGVSLGEFLATARDPEAPGRSAGILLLADESAADEVGTFMGHGVNRIVSLQAPSDRLLSAVAELLSVAPRAAVRRTVSLSLWCEGQGGPLPGETVDLSASGMLVRAGTLPPVGSGVTFELSLPDPSGPVRGEGEVVRHAAGHGESAEAFAVCFISFSSQSWQRLIDYLDE